MKKRWLILLLVFLLCACGRPAETRTPEEMYTAIAEAAELEDMVPLTADELLALTGIEPAQYTSAVAYQSLTGVRPDEVILLCAVDRSAADDLEAKLATRLAYKQKAAELYLTEYQSILRQAVVRRDGLTVALIAVEQMDAAVKAYEG